MADLSLALLRAETEAYYTSYPNSICATEMVLRGFGSEKTCWELLHGRYTGHSDLVLFRSASCYDFLHFSIAVLDVVSSL